MLGFIVKNLISIGSGYLKHKQKIVEAERAAEIHLAKSKAELEITAQKQSIKLAGADAASERAKRHTYVDEILILGPVSLVVYTVVNPIGAAEVIQRLSEYPLWVQLILLGVYVSVFGLRSIFNGISNFVRNK